jgi:hypothetical protein
MKKDKSKENNARSFPKAFNEKYQEKLLGELYDELEKETYTLERDCLTDRTINHELADEMLHTMLE